MDRNISIYIHVDLLYNYVIKGKINYKFLGLEIKEKGNNSVNLNNSND